VSWANPSRSHGAAHTSTRTHRAVLPARRARRQRSARSRAGRMDGNASPPRPA
jgi:hypothetical protein